MQVILTEEEYEELKIYKSQYSNLKQLYDRLLGKYTEIDEKYSKLLVYGVSEINERLKLWLM